MLCCRFFEMTYISRQLEFYLEQRKEMIVREEEQLKGWQDRMKRVPPRLLEIQQELRDLDRGRGDLEPDFVRGAIERLTQEVNQLSALDIRLTEHSSPISVLSHAGFKNRVSDAMNLPAAIRHQEAKIDTMRSQLDDLPKPTVAEVEGRHRGGFVKPVYRSLGGERKTFALTFWRLELRKSRFYPNDRDIARERKSATRAASVA